jgi:hypothetical protein
LMFFECSAMNVSDLELRPQTRNHSFWSFLIAGDTYQKNQKDKDRWAHGQMGLLT